jgi:hypothetical protein
MYNINKAVYLKDYSPSTLIESLQLLFTIGIIFITCYSIIQLLSWVVLFK